MKSLPAGNPPNLATGHAKSAPRDPHRAAPLQARFEEVLSKLLHRGEGAPNGEAVGKVLPTERVHPADKLRPSEEGMSGEAAPDRQGDSAPAANDGVIADAPPSEAGASHPIPPAPVSPPLVFMRADPVLAAAGAAEGNARQAAAQTIAHPVRMDGQGKSEAPVRSEPAGRPEVSGRPEVTGRPEVSSRPQVSSRIEAAATMPEAPAKTAGGDIAADLPVQVKRRGGITADPPMPVQRRDGMIADSPTPAGRADGVAADSPKPVQRAEVLAIAVEKHFQPAVTFMPNPEGIVGKPQRGQSRPPPVASAPGMAPPAQLGKSEQQPTPAEPELAAAGPEPAPKSAPESAPEMAAPEAGDARRADPASPPPDPAGRRVGANSKAADIEARVAERGALSAQSSAAAASVHVDGQTLPVPPSGSLAQQLGTAVLRAVPSEGAPLAPFRREAPERSFASEPTRTILVALEPAELGRVTVRMRNSGQALTVQVVAERAETSVLLERDRHLLRGILGAGGHFEDVAVQVSGPASHSAPPATAAATDLRHAEGSLPQFPSGERGGDGRHSESRPHGRDHSPGGPNTDAASVDAAGGAALYV